MNEYDELPDVFGVVLADGRGSLPFALIHGESLVACAAWALGQSGVTPLDASVGWDSVQEAAVPFVLHDSLCPMTPAAFIASCVRRAVDDDVVVVGVRPVTDTVKVVRDGLVGETVDRAGLLAVASPIVLPVQVVAALEAAPGEDLAALVSRLAAEHPVELVEAPPEARRVASADDVRLLEVLTAPSA
ncbi:2-C-methyl-D-erythritol 4-phosphate cytidylyltransferase [Nocardioides sp. LHG3406-4]|uniref:2-C-methyl-D-erythritol 4-phosphate cytidylyltransferase n=1 Tax=Nocardioides sp. LHG3406-4 TaxID=2804575 RepID=UPI003CF90A53